MGKQYANIECNEFDLHEKQFSKKNARQYDAKDKKLARDKEKAKTKQMQQKRDAKRRF